MNERGDNLEEPEPDDLTQLSAASDQFFEAAVGPELVRIEAEAVLKEMREALRLDSEERAEAQAQDLLAALAGEHRAVRVDLAALEAREVEELERLLHDDK